MSPDQKRLPHPITSGWILPVTLLVLVWGLAIRQLQLEWTFNPQYQYGWIVPILTLLLWWRAWPARPTPREARLGALGLSLVVFLGILAVPLRVIQEANPDWHILNYYYSAQAILVTVLLLNCSGGTPWIRYFIFPLLFPLVAVPWPTELEHSIIQGLQRLIASIGVEGASWMGWSSYQRGNLIVLAQGTVGVNEACSGIRSLQSCLMIALFLGEYLQLSNLRRVALLTLAIIAAFFFNALRAFFLISMMELHGAATLEKFHDPAGFGIAFCSLLLLWIVAQAIAPREKPGSPLISGQPVGHFRFPHAAFLILVGAWLAAEVLNPLWYRWHEQSTRPGPVWSLQWPLPRPEFKTAAIDDSVRTILRYDEGVHGAWNDQDRWEVYFFKWKPSRAAAGLAGFHHPDICLPAAGFVMKSDLGTEDVDIRGLTLPISRYVFEDPFTHRLFYVFQIVTDDRVGPVLDYRETSTELQRLQSAWKGMRNPGQRSLLVVNQGADDLPDAELGLQKLLRDSLVISPTAPTTY